MADQREWRIAVVNSEPRFLDLVERVLEDAGPYEVYTYRDRETSLGELRALDPDLLIIDVITDELPAGWELTVVAGSDRELGDVPIIVTTPEMEQAHHRVEELREVANVHVVPKPFELDDLRETVKSVLESRYPSGPRAAAGG